MLHAVKAEKLGAFAQPMTAAIQSCVHCGFCLAACPTYRELGQEMDTPRGRIVLMKEVLEGTLDWRAAQPHVERCLGCLACEPACPSGVKYGELINPFRALAHKEFRIGRLARLRNFILARSLPYPRRFRLAARVARPFKTLVALTPRALRPLLELVPAKVLSAPTWPSRIAAQGETRARVALLLGCAQQVLDPEINAATIDVLTRNGVEVHIPQAKSCCGALAWHTGELKAAQKFAVRNIRGFPDSVDAIITNAAGCGSAMKEYPLILRGTSFEQQAGDFSARVMDVSVFLERLGLREAPRSGTPRKVLYQDACHLAQAQRISEEPRELLRTIPGLQLLELSEPYLCCGSAGSYNLEQPEIASSLGEKKAKAIIASGCELVASGNIGCMTQLRFHLARLGSSIPVVHTMQVLSEAYGRKPN